MLPLGRHGSVLDLGGGESLETSGGVIVRLPAPGGADAPLLNDLEAAARYVLSEAYRGEHPAEPSWLLRAYYRLRPLMPRPVQLMLRRRHARGRAARAWLGWPVDGRWVALAESWLFLRLGAAVEVKVLRAWPEPFRAAAALTHDVEGSEGQARCLEVAALEERYGFRSCFNFVAERYPLDQGVMDELRARGHEIGLHGIRHDGRKFSSRSIFEERVQAMRRYRDAWRVEGFRSPATHRRWDWMPELPFAYDSSFPDTDPYEPIPGGCGSPWPFRLGDLIELPITLPQDHTVWEILRQPALPLWLAKVDWLRQVRGLATIIVHPDYLSRRERWEEYEAFLAGLAGRQEVWVARAGDIARWWRERRERQRATRVREGSVWRIHFA